MFHEEHATAIRLFYILKALLPSGIDGGISTSPLSYRHWFKNKEDIEQAKQTATSNIIEVVKILIENKSNVHHRGAYDSPLTMWCSNLEIMKLLIYNKLILYYI